MTDTDPEAMDDETLLAQINCHDPYDVEFARRFRALAAERDALREQMQEVIALQDDHHETAEQLRCAVETLTDENAALRARAEAAEAERGRLREAVDGLVRAARQADGQEAHRIMPYVWPHIQALAALTAPSPREENR